MTENQKTQLDEPADQALFEGQLQGLVVTFYQNERPPCGLAGILDWHFHGAISRCIQAGAIQGEVGECIYLPILRNGITFHLILVGAGKSDGLGQRDPIPTEAIHILHKNLTSLQLNKIGISRSDFGNVNMDYFNKHMKGANLWITP